MTKLRSVEFQSGTTQVSSPIYQCRGTGLECIFKLRRHGQGRGKGTGQRPCDEKATDRRNEAVVRSEHVDEEGAVLDVKSCFL